MFKRITAKNFFSWADLDYEIKPGISQITGFNFDDNTPEGCGKSSVPNTLSYVLYGKIPKDAKVDEVVREGQDGGKGSVDFLDGHKVARSRSPNDLYIVEPSGKVVRGKDAKETQLLVNKLVGLDFDAFCQSIYFAQNYPKKFVAAGDVEKVGILSQVLDLTIFDKAHKKAHANLKQEETELAGVKRSLDDKLNVSKRIQSNIDLLVQFIEKFEVEKTTKVTALESNVEKLQERIEALTVNLGVIQPHDIAEELTRMDKMLEELSNKKVQYATSIRLADGAVKTRKQLETNVASTSTKIEKLKAKLDKFKAADKTCPTCGEHVAKHKEATVFKEGQELERDLASETRELKQFQKQLNALPDLTAADDAKKLILEVEREARELSANKKQLWDQQADLKREADNLVNWKKQLQTTQKELKTVEASVCSNELIKLEVLDKELTEVDAELVGLYELNKLKTTKVDNLEIMKVGFKEVKQFVFQALLNELTVKATRLAKDLFEVPISIKFSNENEEGGVSKIITTVTLDGQERSLGLLSGGQHKRVELAVNFALSDIVSSRAIRPINFLILDEPFQNLSFNSMEKVIKLLEERKKPTILIEHNDLIKQVVNQVFDIEYINGTSKVKN